MKAMLTELSKLLLNWYHTHGRQLPWRASRDPYQIWISEVMLQQTTVTAVVPYYERFISRFPNLDSLAQAPLEDVLEQWAGLGYYSRARNLHKSAQHLFQIGGFPHTAKELIELPGFGPYTSRAVASLAFDDNVGVLDGNVIRILSRVLALPIQHWKNKERQQLQELSDEMAQYVPSAELNQSMMDLGATVCTPKSPNCSICPWLKKCKAFATKQVEKLPLPKPRKAKEIWIWKVSVQKKKSQILMVKDSSYPVLKNQWMLPGVFQKSTKIPKEYLCKHNITHHEIYVLSEKKLAKAHLDEKKWVDLKNLSKINPSSLLQKIIAKY